MKILQRLKEKRQRQQTNLTENSRYSTTGPKKVPKAQQNRPPVPLASSRQQFLKKKETEFKLEVQRYK